MSRISIICVVLGALAAAPAWSQSGGEPSGTSGEKKEKKQVRVLLGGRPVKAGGRILVGGPRRKLPKEAMPIYRLTGVMTSTVSKATVKKLDLNAADAKGAFVVYVPKKSAAEKMGIRRGDVILYVNGTSVNGLDSMLTTLKAPKPKDPITYTVVRYDDKKKKIERVTLRGRMPEPRKRLGGGLRRRVALGGEKAPALPRETSPKQDG